MRGTDLGRTSDERRRRRAWLALAGLRSLLGGTAIAVALPLLGGLGLVACTDQGQTAAGAIVSLDSSGGAVHGFTLRTPAGATLIFTIGTLELGGNAFPASHLVVHAVSGDPVVVSYRVTNGKNVAFRLADAPATGTAGPSSSPTASGGAGSPAVASQEP